MVLTKSFKHLSPHSRVLLFFGAFICCFSPVLCEKTNAARVAKETTSAALQKGPGSPLGGHYLLLVNTAIARQLKPQDISAFDKSPYDGLAVAFHYNYDTAPVFSSESMSSQLAEWKKLTH